MHSRHLVVSLAVLLASCSTSDPGPIEPGPDQRYVDAQDCPSGGLAYVEDLSGCSADPLDYLPRLNGSATDQWSACITDASPDDYPRIDPNVSTIARTAAFEEIATKLWEDRVVPGKQDFIDARVAYAVDQGIDSRVQRREDYHYPAASAACSTAGVPETAPDRCVGPAKLLPILNDAFAKGALGERNRIQAARIEAALVWFFYVSTYSEVNSCINTPNNCDSAWAYYTGGTSRGAPLGIARRIQAIGPGTHDRGFDAALAARCWRDLDQAVPAAQLDLQGRARAQYDRALLRGMALVARKKFAELSCATAGGKEARLTFLQTFLPLLDRAARAIDSAKADVLKAQAQATTVSALDPAAAIAALDALFPCP
ncbi:MAG: hypothetical protein EHM78_16480 [Myxococcaceae bacterium]|nr:MAG: hypothetical protein EHM78_16480 [Myxococcaceae bacterium]